MCTTRKNEKPLHLHRSHIVVIHGEDPRIFRDGIIANMLPPMQPPPFGSLALLPYRKRIANLIMHMYIASKSHIAVHTQQFDPLVGDGDINPTPNFGCNRVING
jgi:hypothetical protein